MRRLAGALALAASLAALPSCGPGKPPPAPARQDEARWSDALESMPELYVVVRPKALKRDATFGAFFDALMRVARSRHDVGGETVVSALADADEVIIAASRSEPGDLLVVLRGVPGSLDPARVEEGGHPVFRAVSRADARVPELEAVDRRAADPASLFVLPGRTWVLALGPAKQRARDAFGKPTRRPVPNIEPDALAALRFDGPSLVHRRTTRARGQSALESLGRKLISMTLALLPGKSGLRATLRYEDDDASAWAEHALGRVVEAAAERERLAFLKDAKISRAGNNVVVDLALPPRLLEELPRVTGGDFF